jgi:homogentisate 1,2-dioxygenase
LIYYYTPPTQVTGFKPLGPVFPIAAEAHHLQHRHFRTAALGASGEPVDGRTPLMFNEDVSISLCRPAKPMSCFYKNADGDDLIYVHEGSGELQTMFGHIAYHPGDYLCVPRGTIYRLVPDAGETTYLVIESAASQFEVPKRYRNEYGQLLEHAPFCERDFRSPDRLETRDEAGEFEVRIKAKGHLTAYYYDRHPFNVVGWDGLIYPWAFNIADFEPITGSLHMPPPIHQTFEARNFVVCSFCPRNLDYHPQAVPIPYNHSNVDSDEMLFYCNDKFGSRKGIEIGSITLHPSGIPHGPQPGAVEASLGKTRTEELAVMVDTFRPLKVTTAALGIEDVNYPKSWHV